MLGHIKKALSKVLGMCKHLTTVICLYHHHNYIHPYMSFCLKRKKIVCIFISLNSFYLDFVVEPVALFGLFLTYLIFVLKYLIFALLGLSWEVGIAKGVKGLEKHQFVGVKSCIHLLEHGRCG